MGERCRIIRGEDHYVETPKGVRFPIYSWGYLPYLHKSDLVLILRETQESRYWREGSDPYRSSAIGLDSWADADYTLPDSDSKLRASALWILDDEGTRESADTTAQIITEPPDPDHVPPTRPNPTIALGATPNRSCSC